MALTRRQLEEIYRDLEVPLYNFALRWVFNSALAEEVVHDAFIRIWTKRQDVDPESIKSLLYKTVQNLSFNELRKRRIREVVGILDWFKSDTDENQNAERKLIEQEDLHTMQICLEKLPMELREVLLLSMFSDMTYAEISQTLEIAEGTVASRKNRALQLMRDYFKSTEGNQNG